MLGEKISSDSFFDHVIFCTNVTYADGHFKGGRHSVFSDSYRLITFLKDLTAVAVPTETLTTLAVQHQLASSWSSLMPSFPSSHIHVLPTIEDAVQLTQSINTNPKTPIKVLVTGSLHLVGGLIEAAGLADQAL